MRHIKHLIGNVKSMFFWLDPWLPSGRLINTFGHTTVYDLDLGIDLLVSYFIKEGSWNLPIATLNELAYIFAMIRAFHLLAHQLKDEIV